MNSNYIARTKTQILDNLLEKTSNEYIKIPGSFIYDFNKTVAIELSKAEEAIQSIWEYFYIDKLKGEELEQRIFELQGIQRKTATFATGELTISGNGQISIGDLFESINGVQFKSIEDKYINNNGVINIRAVKPGISGNVGARSITKMPITIPGIKSVINNVETRDGFDSESDESLRNRYYIKVQAPATSGNKYHYELWAREVPGIGDCYVIPLWNGHNTVKVIVINDLKEPASPALVEKVQNYIDPKGARNETWGCGAGQAPIGAYCTVESALKKDININLTLTKEHNVDLENLKLKIKENIINFLKEIAFKKTYVSYALLSNAILQTPGVVEWSDLTVNDGIKNIELLKSEVAVLNEISIKEKNG